MKNKRRVVGMKKKVSMLAVLLGAVMAITACSGGKTKQNNDGSPDEISIMIPEMGRVWKGDGHPCIEEMEKATNTKLNVQMISQDQYETKFSLLAAGGDLPDITRLDGFKYQEYMDTGMFMEISDLLEEHGENITKYIEDKNWELTKWKGKKYVIPYQGTGGSSYRNFIRKDWLDKLGLKEPTNLEEYKEVLRAFTFDDPDGNGKNDTYGTSDFEFYPIFGAFGIHKGQTELRDGVFVPVNVSEEYREALKYIRGLVEEGVVGTEFAIESGEQREDNLIHGRYGSTTGWWSFASDVMCEKQMAKINPKADWSLFDIKGENGDSGFADGGTISGTVQLSKNASNPEACMRFLNYLISDEGFLMSTYGILDVHYTKDESDPWLLKYTDAGYEAKNERWFDPLSQLMGRRLDILELQEEANESDPHAYDGIDPVRVKYRMQVPNTIEYETKLDGMYGLPLTDAENLYGTEVSDYESDMYLKFITGKASLEKDWDSYVKTWRSKGGEEILKERVKLYNELKGTKYKSVFDK